MAAALFNVLARHHRIAVAALASLCGSAVLAQPADFRPPPLFDPALPTRADPGPRHYPGGVAYLPDITYKSVPGFRPLKLDLYVPPPARQPGGHPVVVWIHGGGYELGNPRADWTYGDWRRVLGELASRGYVVAGVSYRLSSEAPFPAPLDDVKDAVRFLRQHASRWGADGTRVITWGLSAGGGLSALMGVACANGQPATPDPAGQPSACVQGTVDWFGPSSFEGLAQAPVIRRFLGCTATPCTPQQVQAASARSQVRRGVAPFLIMQGEADPLVTPEQSTALGDALNTAGVANEVIVYPGLGHGFDGAPPAQLRQILLRTFEGIDRLAGQRASKR